MKQNIMVTKKDTQLFNKMQNIVKRYVKFYREDFETDKKWISEILDKNDDTIYERYLYWIVRKCGTNIGYKSNVPLSSTYSYYMSAVEDNGENHRYYEIDLEKKTVTYIKDKKSYLETCKLQYKKTAV